MDMKEIFTHTFKSKGWTEGGVYPVSGSGSTVEYTENLRNELPEMCEKLNIKSLLDAPCGDWTWMQHTKFPNDFYYEGGDIVNELIDNLRVKYPNTKFSVLDITKDTFPNVDAWMCRDCLFHLSYKDIASALRNFISSKVDWALLTSHIRTPPNEDIYTGDYRHINLFKEPFNLPTNVHVIWDFPWPFFYYPKGLFFFRREDIAKSEFIRKH